jgi:hypothetical protein
MRQAVSAEAIRNQQRPRRRRAVSRDVRAGTQQQHAAGDIDFVCTGIWHAGATSIATARMSWSVCYRAANVGGDTSSPRRARGQPRPYRSANPAGRIRPAAANSGISRVVVPIKTFAFHNIAPSAFEPPDGDGLLHEINEHNGHRFVAIIADSALLSRSARDRTG